MNCWDCAHLGRCQRASKRVKICSAYRDYNYNEKGVPYEDVAKILGISVRTLHRRLNENETAVLTSLKKKGKNFTIVKSEKCNKRTFYEVK